MRVNELGDYRTETTKECAPDRQQLSGLEDTTETIEVDIDDLTDAEEKNCRVRTSVSRIINLVRDYETKESVDDDSPNLAAEATNAGRQLFETVQHSEQNTELVNFREKRAESQQVEDEYLDVSDGRWAINPRDSDHSISTRDGIDHKGGKHGNTPDKLNWVF